MIDAGVHPSALVAGTVGEFDDGVEGGDEDFGAGEAGVEGVLRSGEWGMGRRVEALGIRYWVLGIRVCEGRSAWVGSRISVGSGVGVTRTAAGRGRE